MRVLAVDPGYDRLGVAVMEHDGHKEILLHSTCIQTNKQADLPDRLNEVGIACKNLLTQYKPDCMGIETLFFNKNQKTAIGVAQARGVILYLAKQHRVVVKEFGPQEIKVAVTGYGKSDKAAVIAMIEKLIPQAPKNAFDDEYDAIAVGITTLAHHR